MPEADPELPIPTLISALQAEGYRTGLFFSSGWRYAGYTEFLDYQGADRVEDYRNRKGCEAQFLASSAPASARRDEFAASSDQCTADAMKRWLEQGGSPFFTVLWTDQTRYPYQPDGQADADSSAAGIAASRARYLRAIGVADAVISSFVDWLESRNLLDDTLVVVVGDHGEGFGQHGVLVHGNEIYDEFVRVPLALINRKLFSGVIRHDVVGHIDIAPTIMEALGQPIPADWQGLSLFGAAIRQRTFFMVPWGDVWMGYRQRARKINCKVLGEVLEDFDLATDPGEYSNRAGSLSESEQQKLVANLWAWQRSLVETYEIFRSRRDTGN